MDQLVYSAGTARAIDLQTDLVALWSAISEDDQLRSRALGLGADVGEILDRSPDETYDLQPEGSGLDPVSTAIVVAFIGSASKTAMEGLWKEFVLPWIRARRGDDAIGGEKSEKD